MFQCLFSFLHSRIIPFLSCLQFNSFDVKEKDTVRVYDGKTSSEGIRLHSGAGFSSNNPPTITLTAASGAMVVLFNSDPLRAAKGWSANFSAGACFGLDKREGLGYKREGLGCKDFNTVIKITSLYELLHV